MTRPVFALVGVLTLALVHPAWAALVADDFDDNTQGTQWSKVQDDGTKTWVDEVNQRLELRAAGTVAGELDALYLSAGPTGFGLSTGSDFQMRVDYSLTGGTVPNIGDLLVLDLGFGTTAGGENSLGLTFTKANVGAVGTALAAAYRVNDVQTTLGPNPSLATAGTLYISYIRYDPTSDTVYLSDSGYGAGNADFTISNIVQAPGPGGWGASVVFVGLGGRSQNTATSASGDAFLDNFQVDQGVIVPVPEPATMALLGLGGVGVIGRMVRRRRQPERFRLG